MEHPKEHSRVQNDEYFYKAKPGVESIGIIVCRLL